MIELLDNYNSDDSDDDKPPAPPVAKPGPPAGSFTLPPLAGVQIPEPEEEDGDRGDAEEDEEEDDDEAGSGFDSDLADEINKGLEAMNAAPAAVSESDSDNDGLFGGSSDDEDDEDEDEEAGDPEALEAKRRIKLLLEEAGDLDRAIKTKVAELEKTPNPILKVRSHFTSIPLSRLTD